MPATPYGRHLGRGHPFSIKKNRRSTLKPAETSLGAEVVNSALVPRVMLSLSRDLHPADRVAKLVFRPMGTFVRVGWQWTRL